MISSSDRQECLSYKITLLGRGDGVIGNFVSLYMIYVK